MISKHKLLATMTAGTLLAASFLGIQTYYTTTYTTDASAESVVLRTPTSQDANFSRGGTKVLAN